MPCFTSRLPETMLVSPCILAAPVSMSVFAEKLPRTLESPKNSVVALNVALESTNRLLSFAKPFTARLSVMWTSFRACTVPSFPTRILSSPSSSTVRIARVPCTTVLPLNRNVSSSSTPIEATCDFPKYTLSPSESAPSTPSPPLTTSAPVLGSVDSVSATTTTFDASETGPPTSMLPLTVRLPSPSTLIPPLTTLNLSQVRPSATIISPSILAFLRLGLTSKSGSSLSRPAWLIERLAPFSKLTAPENVA
mmetsp:Transcript_5789/g.10377  ORF Transcript_5789/g.10377 Transcript_5789/m.10377 type:complete len:251 (-) Transcript_5789:942-1694(-)